MSVPFPTNFLTRCKPASFNREDAGWLNMQLCRMPLVDICNRDKGSVDAIALATVFDVKPSGEAKSAIVVSMLPC